VLTDLPTLQDALCKALCAEVRIVERPGGVNYVSTPFMFPDGDSLPIHFRMMPTGGVQLTDMGSTLMRLSYDIDSDTLRDGTRGRILGQILGEYGLQDLAGQLVMESTADQLGRAVMQFGQALTKVSDLSFLTRINVENSFYEDLAAKLGEIVGADNVERDYLVPSLPQAENYPVDYLIKGTRRPLYVFGIPNRDKARLATIILQHLIQRHEDFDSAVVFRNADELPRSDVSRLMNAANDMVSSLDAGNDLERKIRRRTAA
jgi:hypothetical protein